MKNSKSPLSPHHSITPIPSPHSIITPSLHHSITPLLHYSITPLLHYSIASTARLSVNKTSSDIAQDQRVVILAGLVANNSRMGAARRTKLVLSGIGDPG